MSPPCAFATREYVKARKCPKLYKSVRTFLSDDVTCITSTIMTTRELNFVAEAKELEEYLCPVCTKVLVDPHATECCGQHFCEQCLKKWFREQGRTICPHCRSTKFIHSRYLPLKRKINELLVYCSNGK